MQLSYLHDFGILEVKGQDSAKFLQGQLTINVDKLDPNVFLNGAVCNPQGRCIASFWVKSVDEQFLFVMPKDNIDTLSQHLKKYAVFYKVELTEKVNSRVLGAYDYSDSSQAIDAIDCFTNQLGLMIEPKNAETTWSLAQNDWLSFLVKNKVAWISQLASSNFLPHNMGLTEISGVDFQKGCFTGQEVIARMQYKGKLKSHIQKLYADNPLDIAPNSKILAENKNAGEVICSVCDSSGNTYVLAVIKDRYIEQNNFHLDNENTSILKLIK